MARTTATELRARIALLEERNAMLERRCAELAAAPTASGTAAPSSVFRRQRSAWWTVLAAVLAILGLVLAPVAVVLGYVKTQLSDTQGFVDTFAPLAESPEVQQAVTAATVVTINDAVDIPALTSDVFGGIESLGLPTSAATALRLLEGPATQGLQSLVATTVASVVESDAFVVVWREALQLSHSQLVSTLSGDAGALVTISDADAIEVQLGPVIEVVRQRLIDNGIGFASVIPTVDVSIEIAQADGIGQARLAYAAALTLGLWLPWISLALLLGAVAAARRRRVAAIVVFTVLGVLMVVMGIALAVARTVVVTAETGVTAGALGVIYDTAVASMVGTISAVAVVAIAVAVIAWIGGPSRIAVATRGIATWPVRALRGLAREQGMNTGAVGRWVDRQHTLVLVIVGLLAAVIVVFVRPLTATLVILTALVAIVVLLIAEFVRAPAPVS